MSVPITQTEPEIKQKEIDSWLKKHKLKKTAINITKATNALRAEKQADALPAGTNVSHTGADVPRQVIYGEVKTGGTIVFLDSRGNNQLIDIVVAIATHEIQGVVALYLDDCQVLFQAGVDGWSASLRKPDGTIIPALNKIFLRVATGADDQFAIGDLIGQNPAKWTWDHKLSGVAHAYIILVWDAYLFGDGLPDISFRVQGKKVYDPRFPAVRYTATAALCIADYLCNSRFGVGVDYAARIDEGSLVDAANVCDELVTLQSGGQEYRYTINGYFSTDESHGNILERMAAAMGGHITYSNGKWKFWPAKWRAPTLVITEDDFRSSIKMQTMVTRNDIFNAVRGTYVSAAKDFIETDYPPVKNSYYRDLDGREIFENIDFHFVTSTPTCQRLAKLELERIRQGIQLELDVSPKMFQAQVPENIAITYERYGWVEKPFEVTKADFVLKQSSGDAQELVVSLNLRETAEGVFTWNYWEETTTDVAPNTTLPSPFGVPNVTGLALESGTAALYRRGDGTVAPRIKVSWTAFNDFFLTSGGTVEIQYKPSSASDWLSEAPVPGSSSVAYISDVQDGIYYDVRARAVNTFHTASDWTTVSSHFVVGKTAPPADVTGFAAVVSEYGIQLAWTNVSDLDLKHYRIIEGSSEGSGTVVFQNLGTRVSLDLRAAGTHTFWIRAVDTSNNLSLNVASVSIVITAPQIPGGSTTATISGPDVILDWAEAINNTWAIDVYNIYYGDTFETSTLLVNTKATLFQTRVNWQGPRTFWIEPRDIYGNVGAATSVALNIESPGPVIQLVANVVDNNVLLKWNEPTVTGLPIAKYIVGKGDEDDAYEDTEVIGDALGTFTVVFELISGRYGYWVEAVDTAGNAGTPTKVIAIVNEPPDFELAADYQAKDGTTLLNVVERPSGRIIGPLNTLRTWRNHFEIPGWTSPQDQIDAGFPYFAQPTREYGRWEKITDLGTTLENVLIHLSFDREDIVAGVDLTYKIAYSEDDVSYVEEENVFAVLATSVRYIRIRMDFGTVP